MLDCNNEVLSWMLIVGVDIVVVVFVVVFIVVFVCCCIFF